MVLHTATKQPALLVSPQRIVVQSWRPFRVVCVSTSGSQPTFVFSRDRSPVEKDRRYIVRRFNTTAVELTSARGLRGQEDVDEIE